MRKSLKERLAHIWLYLSTLLKWIAFAVVTGIICGVVGSVFHIGVHHATELRMKHPWLLYCLPLAGLLIGVVYKGLKTTGYGTNTIIDEVHTGKGISFWLLPTIFLTTMLTHLCGGSAGREGAALQMGGTIGYHAGRAFRLDDRDERIATMVGMAAFFTALFGTPMAATYFSMGVISVGIMYHAALVPCLISALSAYGVSLVMGVEPTRFTITMPALELGMMLRVLGLSVLCALVSILFCRVMHFFEHVVQRMENEWLRCALGGVCIIILTLLCGTTDYNGAGMEVITAAVESGQARPEAFLLKLLFTAITLSVGYKGGEVVPSFFVGATFGCVAAPLLGIPAGVGAAIGMVAVFCGATNCPMASIFLAVELFGDGGLMYFALACGISYLLSGYNGLYSSQTIMYSKLKAQYINVRTNHHHAGDPHAEPPVHGNVKDRNKK